MKLSSNSLAISDVLKNKKTPDTGFWQPECGGDRDALSTRLLREGWRRCHRTHERGPHSCVLMHTPPNCVWLDMHLHSSTCSNSTAISPEPPPHDCQSCLSHCLAGFRWSRSANALTSFSAPVSSSGLRTPRAWKASTHGGCMWLSPPMQHGDSAPWQRLQVQNLHVKMLR